MNFKHTVRQLAERKMKVIGRHALYMMVIAASCACSNKSNSRDDESSNKSTGVECIKVSDTASVSSTDSILRAGIAKRRSLCVSKEEFCKSITDPDMGVYKATVTDVNMLVIAVRPIGNPNFDAFAESYLESAINAGVTVKGCLVVDVDKSTFQDGAVVGDRIGKAYR